MKILQNMFNPVSFVVHAPTEEFVDSFVDPECSSHVWDKLYYKFDLYHSVLGPVQTELSKIYEPRRNSAERHN